MTASSSYRIHGFDCSLFSTPKTHIKIRAPVSSIPFYNFSRPNFGPNCDSFRLRSSYKKNKEVEQWIRVPMISCLVEDSSEAYTEKEYSSVSNASQEEASIDLKLPRRSLLATFTCNACGARSERLINRLAYERGLVYVQCSGCSQYHKLVDNLGLVVEYKLQEEIDLDTSANQV
ncbi:hypothetical protein ACJIZ3_020076 [Penstemon smallii]|uniref:DNL-type domain-containing protein n=1 Tax=Penstemon smallii TaxID=265156 RepID=A0ABD3SIB3_9LAMI